MMSTSASATKPRKVVPKILAIIDADECTGCLACVEVCPVDCIDTIPDDRHSGIVALCEIDLDRCIGCRHCAVICPWFACKMVDTPSITARVADKGGPAWYVAAHQDELMERARRNADEFLAKKRK
jgi:electron transport complex protein RnfB